MSQGEEDRTTTGRGVLVVLALLAGILILVVGFQVGDMFIDYLR